MKIGIAKKNLEETKNKKSIILTKNESQSASNHTKTFCLDESLTLM